MIVKRKLYSFFNLFNKKVSYCNYIDEHYSWALDYLDYLRKLADYENNRLDLFKNSKPSIEDIFVIDSFFYIPDQDPTDYLAYFSDDLWFNYLREKNQRLLTKYIKYDPDLNSLVLKEGYLAIGHDQTKDPLIKEIKNKSDLSKICKDYFKEYQKTLSTTNITNKIIDCFGEGYLNNVIGDKQKINKFFIEFKKSIDSIISKI